MIYRAKGGLDVVECTHLGTHVHNYLKVGDLWCIVNMVKFIGGGMEGEGGSHKVGRNLITSSALEWVPAGRPAKQLPCCSQEM